MKVVEIAKDNTNSGEHATGVCYYSGSGNGFNLMQNIKSYKDIIA
jgi:hypothetical protein